MGKINLDEDGDLKQLEAEFQKMASADELHELNEEVEARVQEQQAKAAGALPKWIVISGIVVAVLLVGLIAFLLMRNHGASVSVPNVVGMAPTAATSALSAVGFRVLTAYDENSKSAPGSVISQRPPAGTKVQAKSDVTIVISGKSPNPQTSSTTGTNNTQSGTSQPNTSTSNTSSGTTGGTEKVAVPDVVGMVDANAKDKLTTAGLKAVQTDANDPAQPDGIVVACDPKANAMVERGAIVHISVNKKSTATNTESAGNKVALADYTGLSAQDVVGDLQGKGLSVTEKYESAQQAPNTVIRTEPGANTEVASGSAVTVIIAR
ncbi:MAG TPA: PASTA domain-containing protein [Armatimonadota bacterium]|nr:PASTA domain-containing protein [Armatimonadota bacterium]